MAERRPIFRLSQEQVWKQFAKDIGAEFESGGSVWGGDKITAKTRTSSSWRSSGSSAARCGCWRSTSSSPRR
ncbi:hypothetical protein FJZ36_04685 [Candidatus Poribacteria bacterium]|nr:hypothetical protein [Candidatus Poribacteria bacterium]